MDRLSIIQATYLKNSFTNNGNGCGEEICECEAIKTEKKKSQLLPFATTVLSAFACAMILTSLRMNIPVDVMESKKNRTITCGYRGEGQKREQFDLYDEHHSNKNGNCPHPSASLAPWCCNDSKRKKNQVC
jgi:hypothetical protein